MSELATSRTIQAAMTMPLGQVSLVHEQWRSPYEHSGRSRQHHLQFSLSPFRETGQACFPETWGSKRFEPFGKLFHLPAEHVIHARSNCPEQKSIVYNFDAEALERWFDGSPDWSARQLERSLAMADPEISRLMSRIGQELRNPGFASETLIELMAAEIIIALSRRFRRLDSPSAKGGLSPWRLRLIDEFLEAHPDKASLTTLADACQLSVRQLSRAFQLSRGCSIGTFIAQSTMAEARRRLASGYALKNVAKDMGFSSASNFSAAFRRVTGETPRSSGS